MFNVKIGVIFGDFYETLYYLYVGEIFEVSKSLNKRYFVIAVYLIRSSWAWNGMRCSRIVRLFIKRNDLKMFEIVHICSGFFAYVHVRTVTCWSFVYTQVYEYISTPISSAKLCSICKLFRNQTQSVIEKHNRALIGTRVSTCSVALIFLPTDSSWEEIIKTERFCLKLSWQDDFIHKFWCIAAFGRILNGTPGHLIRWS